MNDHWSENYWDNYIRKKFSYNKSSRDLTIVELCKVYDYPRSIFCGHTDNDYIVKVSYWSEDTNLYLGVGYGETYYEADDITTYQLFLKDIDDEAVIDILKNEFRWNIINYFSFCE
jgi:hypothetical protein